MKTIILSAAFVVLTSATVSAKSDTPRAIANGYPYTQVPFTSVNIAQGSFLGGRA